MKKSTTGKGGLSMDNAAKQLTPRIQIALENKEWLKAYNLCLALLASDPKSEVGRYCLIDSLIMAERFDLAMTKVREFLQEMPKNNRLSLYLLHLLVYHREFEEATTVGRMLLKRTLSTSEQRDAMLHTAFALHGKGEIRQAVRLLNALLEEDPLNTDAFETIGKIFFEQGHLDEAERIFLELSEVDPTHPRVHQLLGLLYSEQGKWEEAILEWQDALEISPSDEILRELGWSLSMAGEKDAAISMLEEALSLNPMNLQARIDLGSVLMDQKNIERAISEWKIAQTQDPGNSMIRLYLENAQKAAARTTDAATPRKRSRKKGDA